MPGLVMSIAACCLFFRRLGVDGRAHAAFALARRHGEEIRALVDEDVVAGDFVAAAIDARRLEQLDLAALVVELDALGLALEPAALLLGGLRVLALAKAHRIA